MLDTDLLGKSKKKNCKSAEIRFVFGIIFRKSNVVITQENKKDRAKTNQGSIQGFFSKNALFFAVVMATFCFFSPVSAEVDLDYNYYYEKNGPYTKFSDWVPYRLHKWEPRTLEDYYELANLKQHYGEAELRRNIYFLTNALNLKFRHPRNALCEVKTEEDYYKYRNLLFMHLNLGIMRSYMRIASLYDKRHLYFYNLDFAYDLDKSFSKSELLYKEAIPYWDKARFYADRANEVPVDLDLGTLESEVFEIVTGKLDFGQIIGDHLERLKRKRATVTQFLKENPDSNQPKLDFPDRVSKKNQ